MLGSRRRPGSHAVCTEVCIFDTVDLRLTLPAGRGKTTRHGERLEQAPADALAATWQQLKPHQHRAFSVYGFDLLAADMAQRLRRRISVLELSSLLPSVEIRGGLGPTCVLVLPQS